MERDINISLNRRVGGTVLKCLLKQDLGFELSSKIVIYLHKYPYNTCSESLLGKSMQIVLISIAS